MIELTIMEVWGASPQGLSEILYEVCLRTICLQRKGGGFYLVALFPLDQGLACRLLQLAMCGRCVGSWGGEGCPHRGIQKAPGWESR